MQRDRDEYKRLATCAVFIESRFALRLTDIISGWIIPSDEQLFFLTHFLTHREHTLHCMIHAELFPLPQRVLHR